jgi:hypothetical protein
MKNALEIPGISVDRTDVDLMDSSDLATTVTIKDGHGNEISFTVCYGKITQINTKQNGKNSSSINQQQS